MSAANKALVQRLFLEMDRHDFLTMMELCSDCVYHLPLVGVLRGEALNQFFVSMLAAFPDHERTVEDQFSDDLHVVTRWTATGTHQGQFMGVAPTGREIALRGINIFRIRDGRIVERWGRLDDLGLFEQLGLVAGP